MMTTAEYQECLRTKKLPKALTTDGGNLVTSPAPGRTPKVSPRPRHTPGAMNKTEAAYADEVLAPLIASGAVLQWLFEPLSLRLAKSTHYQPDFMLVEPQGITFVEIKGTHFEDDSRAKWKIAAALHWWATFKWVVIKMKKGCIESLKEEVYQP
jgi:hypothetical protein